MVWRGYVPSFNWNYLAGSVATLGLCPISFLASLSPWQELDLNLECSLSLFHPLQIVFLVEIDSAKETYSPPSYWLPNSPYLSCFTQSLDYSTIL